MLMISPFALVELIHLFNLTLKIETFLLERLQLIKQFIPMVFIQAVTRQSPVDNALTFFKRPQISAQVALVVCGLVGRDQGVRIERKHIDTGMLKAVIAIRQARVYSWPVSQTSMSITVGVVMQLEMV
ncbi:MAG: hypothetical protein GY904_32090 [Planctomycetaceae bacterium]|nr:hypothetical protein [Planctomycetaceae bacterium]